MCDQLTYPKTPSSGSGSIINGLCSWFRGTKKKNAGILPRVKVGGMKCASKPPQRDLPLSATQRNNRSIHRYRQSSKDPRKQPLVQVQPLCFPYLASNIVSSREQMMSSLGAYLMVLITNIFYLGRKMSDDLYKHLVISPNNKCIFPLFISAQEHIP